jgi:hypothetical protein
MRFYTRSANRYGGESDTYDARVRRASSDEVAVAFTWQSQHGGTQHGELTLEPDAARWLAYALLKAVEEHGEAEAMVVNGVRRP